MTTIKLTKEQLFADLNKDGISNDDDQITKAKNGDGDAINSIGYEYRIKKKYDKAMTWYRLAADKNNSKAQNNIGYLYHNGLGVPVDYLLAMEWFLKSATQNNKWACGNIGMLFGEGQGVPVNKYKALEWYDKSGEYQFSFEVLTEQLKPQDKNKSLEQLIMETEDILRVARTIKEKQLMNKMEEESDAKDSKIKALQEENQTLRLTSDRQQQELDVKQESINQYKRKEQTINSELLALKQENHTLKLKLEAKDNKVTLLEKEIKLLQIASENSSQGTNKTHGSNSTKGNGDTNDSNNDTDYDTEHDNTVGDNNDINYDTPDEEDNDDNNDLNYDSDDQIKNRRKVALT